MKDSGPADLDSILPFTDQTGVSSIAVPDTTGMTAGTYTFTLTASDYYSGIEVSYQIELVIQPACYFATLDASAQSGYSATYSYGSNYEFQAAYVSSDPSCAIEYTCS